MFQTPFVYQNKPPATGSWKLIHDPYLLKKEGSQKSLPNKEKSVEDKIKLYVAVKDHFEDPSSLNSSKPVDPRKGTLSYRNDFVRRTVDLVLPAFVFDKTCSLDSA
eukprot:Sdes_comp10345_c0_seq1m1990